jgi:hypothetical protein
MGLFMYLLDILVIIQRLKMLTCISKTPGDLVDVLDFGSFQVYTRQSHRPPRPKETICDKDMNSTSIDILEGSIKFTCCGKIRS